MVKKDRKHYLNIKNELSKFLDKNIKNYPNKPKILPSLRNISFKFNVSRNFVKNYLLSEYLPSHFGEDSYQIYSYYWPKSCSKSIELIHNSLIEELNDQFNKYYPLDIGSISSIGKLSRK